MAKSGATSKTRKPSYRVLGTMPDGVQILAPKAKATHFTAREIRQAILKVRRENAAVKTQDVE